jgi:hypothetical protein
VLAHSSEVFFIQLSFDHLFSCLLPCQTVLYEETIATSYSNLSSAFLSNLRHDRRTNVEWVRLKPVGRICRGHTLDLLRRDREGLW